MMDNRIFNVNGKGQEMLLDVLKLAFRQEGRNTKAASWKKTKEHGLILSWSGNKEDDQFETFPSPLDAEQVLSIVLAYLDSEEAKDVSLRRWEKDLDHDGSNSPGWRVYCEDWGHVGGCQSAIVAIKRIHLWHGK